MKIPLCMVVLCPNGLHRLPLMKTSLFMVVLCPGDLHRLTLIVVALHGVVVCPVDCARDNSYKGITCTPCSNTLLLMVHAASLPTYSNLNEELYVE